MKNLLFLALSLLFFHARSQCALEPSIIPLQLELAKSDHIKNPSWECPDGIICNEGIYKPNPGWWAAADNNVETRDLRFLLYQPVAADFPAGTKFPLLIFMDGGAFVGADPFEKSIKGIAEILVRQGYILASIDYRTGWSKTPTVTASYCIPKISSPNDLKASVYRGMQDARTALWFFQDKARRGDLPIDENAIFLGGQSAGAITALHAAYAEQSELDLETPELGQSLGKIDTLLKAKGSSNYACNVKIAGVVAMWGGLLNSSFVKNNAEYKFNKKIPALLFHGEKDPIVPYRQNVVFDDHHCDCNVYPHLSGSRLIRDKLRNFDIACQLHWRTNGSHGACFYPETTAPLIKSFIDDVLQNSVVSTIKNYNQNINCRNTGLSYKILSLVNIVIRL